MMRANGIIQVTANCYCPIRQSAAEYCEQHDLEPMDYDAFICHASEDKESVARPLARELEARGFRVWFDEFQLTIGDSLRRKIDEGLSKSRFGVVILSPSFFAKEWPQRELDGLVTREMAGGGKVILPVWHEVDHDAVSAYSLPLADRYAARTTDGIPSVASDIAVVLGTGNSDADSEAHVTTGAASIHCYGQVERINDVYLVNGREFRSNVSVWLNVRNDGSTAEFSARFWNVRGMPAEWGAYAVRHVSWEGTSSTRPEVDGYGGERRVKAANVARDPRGFWFWTVENGPEQAGTQFLIAELVEPSAWVSITFELEIVNHKTAGKLLKRATLAIPPTPGDPIFTLSDMAEPS